MARTLQINWQHSARQLKYHYRHEKQARKRARLHALWLLRRGKCLLEVADLLDVAYRTLQYWVAWYRQGGLHEVLGRLPGHNVKGKSPKLTPIQQRALVAKVQLGTFRTIGDALQWVHDRWGVTFSYFGLYSCLRRLKCSPKVPRPRSERANLKHQAQWKKGAYCTT